MLQRVQPARRVVQRSSWPPDYVSHYRWRQSQLLRLQNDAKLLAGAKEYYRTHRAEFINHWCDIHEPRNAGTDKLTTIPFLMFRRQYDLLAFFGACLDAGANGLIEKARDMGATWTGISMSVHLFLFVKGSVVGWGSRKEDLVDKIGSMSSIFEKIRWQLRNVPRIFWPEGFTEDHMAFMKVYSESNETSIVGETGNDIGRGARTTIYFKDESAHYVQAESIEAALSDTARVQIDISSVNGLNNVFHRKREAGLDWQPGKKAIPGRTNVMVLDWQDHPDKTQEWYDRREKEATDNGLLHVFRQEVDRDYAASIEGVVIPAVWVRSAIDAHLQIKGMDNGSYHAALDVADEGGDTNALSIRKGVVLRDLREWGERDTGATTRRAIEPLRELGRIDLEYDCNGVGAGIKAEANRLADDDILPKNITFIPWNGGAAVQDPDGHVIEDDNESPLNKDFYGNMKAQAWWSLRRRFEKTHAAITEGITYPPDELISIPSNLPLLYKLQKELSQPTMSLGTRLKLIIDKKPKGTKSPNLADSIVENYFPAQPLSSYDSSLSWVTGITV